MAIEYVNWKIVPKLDYLNKEGIFITVQFCEFGFVSYTDGSISS